jgi:large subunit ribosomal protein L25
MPAKQYIDLARGLHPRLQKFFAQYPPKAILPPSAFSTTTSPLPSTTSSSIPPTSPEASTESLDTPLGDIETLGFVNPFRSQKHAVTGNWHDPIFSLRRQADLAKLARKYGVEQLLPPTIKSSDERLRRRVENGLRVKGTGIGQKVKGKASERTLKGRYVLKIILSEWREEGEMGE